MNGQILTILHKIQKDLIEVKKKLDELEPLYGTRSWWRWSDNLALKDYSEKNYKKASSKKALQSLLNSFKSE